MYGTIARFRLKPGMEEAVLQQLDEFEAANVPGALGEFVYRTDDDPNEYYVAVMFANKAAYVANANTPEQHARYRKWRALLEADPEWHDGEIICAMNFIPQNAKSEQ